jgi:hypothetical protein
MIILPIGFHFCVLRNGILSRRRHDARQSALEIFWQSNIAVLCRAIVIYIVAASEEITFAAKQGFDIRKVYEVRIASAGNSWMFENCVSACAGRCYTPRSDVDIFVEDFGLS